MKFLNVCNKYPNWIIGILALLFLWGLFENIDVYFKTGEPTESENVIYKLRPSSPSFLDTINEDSLEWYEHFNWSTSNVDNGKWTGEEEFEKAQGRDWHIIKAKLKERQVVAKESPSNWLALMAYESAYTFKSDRVNGSNYSYYGLGADALKDILMKRPDLKKYGTTPRAIAAQPDYVELEFMFTYMDIVKKRAIDKGTDVSKWGPQDFYLAWHRPNDAIHGRRGILVPAHWKAAKYNPDLQIKSKNSKHKGAISYWSVSYYYKNRSTKLSQHHKVTSKIII